MAHRIKISDEIENDTLSAGSRKSEDEGATDYSEFIDELKLLVEGRDTPSGSRASDLPISPLLDTEFTHLSDQTKLRPTKEPTEFQAKLATNVYAHAIATPLRVCQMTKIALPKFFLQKIRLGRHSRPGSKTRHLQFLPADDILRGSKRAKVNAAEFERDNDDCRSSSSGKRVYVLSRQSAFEALAGGKYGHGTSVRKSLSPLALRDSKAGSAYRDAYFNPKMHEFIARVLRRRVCDNIVNLLLLRKGYLGAWDTWENAQASTPQSAGYLWLGGDENAPPEFATILHRSRPLSAPKKLPVFNLRQLLSQEDVDSMQDATKGHEMFDQPILSIKSRRMTMSLRSDLWKLQCYIAEHSQYL